MENKPKCLRCGRCCQTKFLLQDSGFIERIFLRITVILHAGFRGIKSPQCKHLIFRHRNSYCAIYENRPQFCREYFCGKAKKQIET